MTRRENILAASRGNLADTLPFFHYWRHSQEGWAERECRNRGMGLGWVRPCHTTVMHGVEIQERQAVVRGRTVVRTTYKTPVGEIWHDTVREPGVGQWKAQRAWRDVSPLQTDRAVKGEKDYKVFRYIVENTEYRPDVFPIEQALDWVGADGIVVAGLPHSPMQSLIVDWVGCEADGRFFLHHADHPELVEEVYQALCRSREPLYRIAAACAADVVLCGDNIDGVIDTPPYFQRYFVPVYRRQAEILHGSGKLMAVHMDGRLRMLKKLIAEVPLDIVEGFHPPPMGDLPLSEALADWPDKAIWVGFPATIYAAGSEATVHYARELLGDMGDGNRVVIQMSTENLVSNQNLLALTSVLEGARLPLDPAAFSSRAG